MNTKDSQELSRRNFLKKGSLGALLALGGAVEIKPDPRPSPFYISSAPKEDPVNCAIIGFGLQGRELADTLGRLPEANLVAVCDDYEVMLRRAQRSVPEASTHTDYREVLDNPDVQVVLIATPTHLHRDIAIEALEAGKHVYCEAPMASSIEDARAMALKAREVSDDQVFQVGHMYRSDPQHRSVFQFIRSGATGQPVMTRAQWHSKESWRRTSPNRERELSSNWRLDPEVSLGLIGEIGIHQIDTASWFLGARPVAVTGFGQIRLWDDGREVPDTIQANIAFSDGTHMSYDATLASSFDSMYDMIYGSDSSIMLRDSKAWMFKEVDAPMLGWEVYARKDTFFKEKGIALVANATQLDAQGVDPAADDPNVETPIWYALKELMDNMAYGPFLPSASYEQAFPLTVVAIKANEAIMQNTRIEIDPASLELG